MALASQMPRGRGGIGPSRGPRRGGGGGGKWGWVVLALLAGGAGYWWYSRSHPPATTQPSETPLVDPALTPPDSAAPVTPSAPTPPGSPSSPSASPSLPPGPAPVDATRKEHAATAPASTMPATSASVAAQMAAGMKLIEEGKMVEGRKALSRLLAAGVWEEPHPSAADGPEGHGSPAAATGAANDTLSEDDAQAIRDTLTSINRTMIFSTKFVKDDPLVDYHVVAADDKLLKITPAYRVPYQAIEYINNTPASRIRVGQRLKLVRGPFHAVVSKREYRMDLYLKDPTDAAMLYIRSFRVGLGESDSTPAGAWIIKKGGKIANPQWSNPKTGEYFPAGDPKNPIGKFWLALDGADDFTKTKRGFGIHGTVDPDSIGKQASMGCVRLADADIELVYKLLSDGLSTVLILP